MARYKVSLNREAVGALLKSEEMQNLLMEHAEKMSDDVEVYVAPTRAVAVAKSNSLNNDMLKRMK